MLQKVVNIYTIFTRIHSKLFTNCHVSWDTLYYRSWTTFSVFVVENVLCTMYYVHEYRYVRHTRGVYRKMCGKFSKDSEQEFCKCRLMF